jgi:hydrogenase expression/formation protein HypE
VAINENVRGMCELLGFDPFYVANEGKIILVAPDEDVDKIISVMKQNEFGKDSAVIGEVVDNHNGKAILKTGIGGKRIIDMLADEQLPRIC